MFHRLTSLASKVLTARRGLAGLLRRTEAATAVEFALIAVPLFAIIVAIFETCSLFVAQEVIQSATSKVARVIFTGKAQSTNMTATQFREMLCNEALALLQCSRLYVNVESFGTFSAVRHLHPVTNGAIDTSKLHFTTGGPGDIIMVQTYYSWPMILGQFGLSVANLNDGGHLIVGTAVFRNEPYK